MQSYTKIDPETKQRILDAVDIVDVVSDFVSLKRRGANYIGLCPFHNERTPSFSVSKSRGICKCFSCGKGGSAVNFLMELESMSYQEALRWLARKYNIEIKERQLTVEEQQDYAERESMLALNQFAMEYFQKTMADTEDGRDIGRAYFTERGINAKSIDRFKLGYSLERGNGLIDAAHARGFTDAYLEKTGLCANGQRGLYDRFHGRVIYPVLSLSGRVVAFGGRTLKTDKSVSKYVNSPESIIYSKSRELYGLYQARQAIARHDKCILVEGYMDVISMHQNGVENVVASSGTSLTEAQVILIRRFTKNVTVIYDSDAAGIKAALRGIDMFLKQGLNVKALLLPEGEDPDSFSQSHTTAELEAYIADNEADIIKFKSQILLDEAGNDPIRRAEAISSILKSVACVADPITRQVYIEECARSFKMDDKVLSLQISKYQADLADEAYKEIQREIARKASRKPTEDVSESPAENKSVLAARNFVVKLEAELLRYAVQYGPMYLCDSTDDAGNVSDMNVFEYLENEFAIDGFVFTSEVHTRLWAKIVDRMRTQWPESLHAFNTELEKRRRDLFDEGYKKIRDEARDVADVKTRELALSDEVNATIAAEYTSFCRSFVERPLCSDDDDDVRRLATDLCNEKFVLSKVHTKFAKVETDQDRLPDLVPRALFELKDAILNAQVVELQEQLKSEAAKAGPDAAERIFGLMRKIQGINNVRAEYAKFLGERILAPRRR